jgi:hypothetical protein
VDRWIGCIGSDGQEDIPEQQQRRPTFLAWQTGFESWLSRGFQIVIPKCHVGAVHCRAFLLQGSQKEWNGPLHREIAGNTTGNCFI